MKEEYYKLLKEKKLSNVLDLISGDIKYSYKYKLLQDLIYKFKDINIINKSLDTYKLDHIDLNRVQIYRLKSWLIYYCRRYTECL